MEGRVGTVWVISLFKLPGRKQANSRDDLLTRVVTLKLQESTINEGDKATEGKDAAECYATEGRIGVLLVTSYPQ